MNDENELAPPPVSGEISNGDERDPVGHDPFWAGSPKDEKVALLESLARVEEAKAKQEEAKASRGGTMPPKPTPVEAINLRWAMPAPLSTLRLEYLVDPYLPARCVVGFYGRGSTAKSSFLATLAASISEDWSTLWVSVEELTDWITQRHLHCGGEMGTLAVFTYGATKRDADGRVVGSAFDVYRDLESAIIKAKEAASTNYSCPRRLRLVVLDTAVGLTGWTKGESANDDAAVKRLIAHLQALAEAHDLSIAIIGHSNKGKHDYIADTVAGSTAWTNSPRLAFVHARDRREEFGYVMRVVKSNLSSSFATTYTTEPVLELHRHEDGHTSVVCRVNVGPIVWGEDAASELFDAATRVEREDADDDGGGGHGHKKTLVETVIEAVVRMVHSSPTPITREMVERELGRPVGRREWKKVDDQLIALQFIYKVQLAKGPQNKDLYQREG